MSEVPQLLFAEAIKDQNLSVKDATAIAWVVKNRMKEASRYGRGEEGVIHKPYQFTGVGSNEWNKVSSGKMTPQEKQIYQKFQTIAALVNSGKIPDPTNGANHYFNPKLAKPSWAKNMKQTYNSGAHEFYRD